MKILLFGGSGQLGYEIMTRGLDLNFEIVAPVISEIDISDTQQVLFLAESVKPELIINCAAYTAVDQAESEKDAAYSINRDGAANVARAARKMDARMIHISTDYVFDGNAREPIPETAPTAPLNVYGASKLEGEQQVAEILGDRVLVVRTSSLHGQKGLNFVHTMIKLFTERTELKVVDDQIMSPTWAGWLAEALLDLSRMKSASGILHASCAGVISWFDFASEIYRIAQPKLPHPVRLERIPAAQYPRAAKRPAYSAFDCSKLSALLGRPPIPWQEGLARHMAEIGYPATDEQ